MDKCTFVHSRRRRKVAPQRSASSAPSAQSGTLSHSCGSGTQRAPASHCSAGGTHSPAAGAAGDVVGAGAGVEAGGAPAVAAHSASSDPSRQSTRESHRNSYTQRILVITFTPKFIVTRRDHALDMTSARTEQSDEEY